MQRGKITSRAISAFLFSFNLLIFSGCGSVKYLIQAGKGQMALFSHARAIPEVIQDEKTPPRIKGLLSEIELIKKWGEKNGLKPTTNYTEYVKLDRNAAVWVVSACDPLQFRSKEWNFPIVGAFPYLGWFDREDAQKFAEDLKKEGLDVDLRGASAYSTLGWFRDAVLSSMISDEDDALGSLANVVIHESVHATLYIKGQAYFNESVASFVADRLTLSYLDSKSEKESKEKNAYLLNGERHQQIEKRFHEAYQQLNQLYLSKLPDSEKLIEKEKILVKLKSDLKFKREINNATLIQYKTYNTGDEEFNQLFETCHQDWRRFMKSLSRLTRESFGQGQQNEVKSVLKPLVESGCE